jgi:hypothetical protein
VIDSKRIDPQLFGYPNGIFRISATSQMVDEDQVGWAEWDPIAFPANPQNQGDGLFSGLATARHKLEIVNDYQHYVFRLI